VGVATLVCLLFGLIGCGHADPIPDRGGASAAGIVLPAGTTGAMAAGGGVGIPVAGIGGVAAVGGVASTSGVAGIGAVAGIGVASGGTLGPAGVGAAMGGTGAAVVSLPPFDAGSDPNRNHVTPGMLCSRLAIIDCAGETHCCNHPGRTLDACRTDVMASCAKGHIDEIAMNPITAFDATAATAAFTTLEQKASQCDTTVAAWGGSMDGLRGILKGTVAANSSCKPTTNLMDEATAFAAMASCANSNTTACLPKSALGSWTCAPKNAAGGACASDNNCKDGIYCNVKTNQLLGTCAARQAVGTSCSTPSQCESLYCKGGRCVAADQQVAYCLATN
jgi:hypothetical protein